MPGARFRCVAGGVAATLACAVGLVSTAAVAVAVPTQVTVAPSDAGDTAATYTVHFFAQADLSAGAASTITLTAPAGTVFPVSASDYTIADNGGTALQVPVLPSQGNANDITLQVPADLTQGDPVTVVATNVGNPTTSGTSYSIDIGDSEGGDTTAGLYTIDPGVADATMTTISTGPASVVADGTTTSTITVQAKDANGNNLLVGGSEVFLITDLGTLNSGLANDNNDGTYTATITSTTVGDATINGIIDGSAMTATAAVTFTQRAQTITFTQPANTALTSGSVTVSATADSGLTVTFTSATTGVCTVSGASVTLLGVGTCTINADQAGTANYAAASTVAKSFTVTQGSQTISFTGPASTALTAGPVSVSATASSGLTVAFTSATTGVCTVSGLSVTLLTAGPCIIHADQAGNSNWAAATTVPQSFTVTQGSQTISFTGPSDKIFGSGPLTLTATATSGLTVTFTSATTGVCVVSGVTVTLLAAGTCTIHADQAGNGNYNAATTVSQTFTVTQAGQTITFAQPASTALSAGPVTVTATTDSELTVAFTSITGAICTVAANSVTLVAVGTCTIHADQEGSANYSSATTVSRSFAVTAAVSEGGTPSAPVTPIVSAARIGGVNRDDTAAQLATAMYPTAGSADVVVLARDDIYADGLTGSPLANALNGVLLITPTSTLSPATLSALQHVLRAGGTVICLGGNAAIDPSVAAELSGLGYNVERIAGADRYETATLIATRIFTTTTVTHIYLATGQNFADALSGADAAGLSHGVVLLTANTTMPAVTKAWIVAHPGLAVTAIGGAAATADPTATAIVGSDRYATAAQVAASVAPAAPGIVLATGLAFPDGLAGAAYAVHNGFALLLINPQASDLGAALQSYLHTASATVSTVLTVGGTTALPAAATGLVTDGLS